ncbi:sugar ABC transporter ATP-binding protein [Aureimonas pseudogalii]|uniref:Ribose transport system ATP-binding protein n=1 Tax=Aureimonas pseudogalii TaxID=1744844 RepID=A0A7W6EES9_9HYPH|nr:sugar ABC transporter ATP-binding protein [Aureimonas pseudogalii]MBB3998067.1 ribose transport system ATP-binding protein [Aureimonas pseudogalii]
MASPSLDAVIHPTDDPLPQAGQPILELRGLEKSYGPVLALKPSTVTFLAGEVHAIVGENGAGKSTLIKLLTGVIRRSGGEIVWQGKPVALATPQEAIDHGINAVHQEVVLCRHLSVAANIFLGDETARYGLLQKREMNRAAQRILDDMGFQLPAEAELGSLTIGQQQLVATARASLRGTRFIIFDEPTAYLTRSEAAQLFALIRRLKAEGVTIVYISHRMEEIFELADRVSVLRDGTHVGTRLIGETDDAELVSLMINRSLDQIYHKEEIPIGKPLIETRNLSGKGFEDVSLTVRAGEIVGLYGLIGAGRSEFALSLFGRNPKTGGEMRWKGAPIDVSSERQAIDLGIALAPESRRDQGLALNLPIGLNLNLPIYDRLTKGITLSRREEAEHADRQIKDLQIKTPSRRSLASSMSGGNQQKIVIGKWLNHGAELFIFDEPTVGVDVGTKAEIYRLFAKLLKNGAGILLISSYLPEVYELSDTLHVFRSGRLVGSSGFHQATHEDILAQAIGV